MKVVFVLFRKHGLTHGTGLFRDMAYGSPDSCFGLKSLMRFWGFWPDHWRRLPASDGSPGSSRSSSIR